jgi:hypothetical protein
MAGQAISQVAGWKIALTGGGLEDRDDDPWLRRHPLLS